MLGLRTHEPDNSDALIVVEAYDQPAPVPANIVIVTRSMSVFSTGSDTEPEAAAGTLASTIAQVRQDIAAGKFRSETDISYGVVSRILDKLDWPVFDVQVVAREFKIGARKVDYALCHAPGEPSAPSTGWMVAGNAL